MNIALKALGCRLNEAELQTWAREFQQRGHVIAKNPDDADLIVLNTCAVTQEAVKKSRQLIRKTQRKNPRAKLIVSGCYASLDEQLQNDIEGIDLIVNNQNKDQLVSIASEMLELPTMPSVATAPGEFSLFSPNRSRAFVKVQDGCRYRCTFCIVTVARGEERSRAINDIVNEVKALVASGVKEVVLTGVHIGGYGSDIESDLYTLIKTVLEQTDIPRLRLGSVEPWDLSPNFFTLFDNPRFMPHLHLPLQSGSDTVLRRMARRCKTADYRQLIDDARRTVQDFLVTTDLIVGFPGESDEEWQQTMEYVASIGFSHMHIFSYSPRAGTKAAVMSDHIDASIKKQRSQEMHALAEQMKQQALQDANGKTYEILWENTIEQDDEGQAWRAGYTPNFLRVMQQVAETKTVESNISRESVRARKGMSALGTI